MVWHFLLIIPFLCDCISELYDVSERIWRTLENYLEYHFLYNVFSRKRTNRIFNGAENTVRILQTFEKILEDPNQKTLKQARQGFFEGFVESLPFKSFEIAERKRRRPWKEEKARNVTNVARSAFFSSWSTGTRNTSTTTFLLGYQLARPIERNLSPDTNGATRIHEENGRN